MSDEITGLLEYMMSKKREACPVCQLPPEVREQLKIGQEKGIKVHDQLEWLAEVTGESVARTDLLSHRSQGHDHDR